MKNFETETAPLALEEERSVPTVIELLSSRIGNDNAITGREISREIDRRLGLRVSGARIRKLIHYVRVNDLVPLVAASSAGYYVIRTAREAADYQESLRERILAIRAVLAAFTRQCAQSGTFQYDLFEDGM